MLLAFVPLATDIGSMPAFGAEMTEIRIEQVQAAMPEITVYFSLGGVSKTPETEEFKAFLDGEPLENVELAPFQADDGIRFVFLVDTSASIKRSQMAAAKKALLSKSESLSPKDRMLLFGFGSTVELLLEGGESKEERSEAIDALSNTGSETKLYDAIDLAVTAAEGKAEAGPDRAVLVIVTDGANYDEGGHTKGEVEQKLARAGLPLYALGFKQGGGANEELDNLGMLARESGGVCLPAAADKIEESFQDLLNDAESCFVIKLRAKNNITVSAAQTLRLEFSPIQNGQAGQSGETRSDSAVAYIRESIPDNENPTVSRIEQIEGRNGIRIFFSEPVLGAGPDSAGAYIVTDKNENAVGILAASYSEEGGIPSADAIFSEQLYSGDYFLAFSGVTDVSMEKNPLTEKTGFSYEGRPVVLKYLEIVFVRYWWAAFAVCIAVVLLLVLRYLKKRKGLVKIEGKVSYGDMVEYKHHFETPDTAPVSLIVTDIKGIASRVDVEVNKSFFVGRSQINNLAFDDAKMSRQHFVIETEGDSFFLIDLATTNGTFLNGVQVNGKRKMEDNDVITAGNEKFVFRASKNREGE
jgi:hypothetical protein